MRLNERRFVAALLPASELDRTSLGNAEAVMNTTGIGTALPQPFVQLESFRRTVRVTVPLSHARLELLAELLATSRQREAS